MKARRFLLAAVLSVVGCVFAIAGCGETVDENHQHDYEWEITTPATCQQEGERKGKCKTCGNETTEAIPRAAHKLEGEITVITPSTCMAKGKGTQKCSVCNTDQPVDLEYAAHTMTHHEEDPATCLKDGSIEYWNCSVCGRNFSDEEGKNEVTSVIVTKETIPHQYDERGVCSVCGAHNPDVSQHICTPVKVNGTAADCKTEGVQDHYECKTCGKVYKDAEGKEETTLEELKIERSTDHNAAANAVFYDEVESKSCLQYGKKEHYDCKVCGRHFKDAELTQELVEVGPDGVCDENTLQNDRLPTHVDASGKAAWHYYGGDLNDQNGVAATCTDVGWKEGVYICSICGQVFRDEEFDATNNCLKEGTRDDGTPYAPLDREQYSIPIDPDHHSENPQKHEADRTKPEACGLNKAVFKETCYECTYCGKYFDDETCTHELSREDVLNFGEHRDVEEEFATESTCTENGHPHCWTCKSCGEYFNTADPAAETTPLSDEDYKLPLAPHAFTVPKSNSSGHWYACAVCGIDETNEDGIIMVEEHLYEEGDDDKCQVCGFGGIDFIDFFEVTRDANNTYATITGFSKENGVPKILSSEETTLRIPERDRLGLPITEIAASALSSDNPHLEYKPIFEKKITKIYIPATVKKIGANAFHQSWIDPLVTDIEFEASTDYVDIGMAAFAHFTNLKRVTLPTKMERIPDQLFGECISLKTVKMPTEVQTGGAFAKTFMNCHKLESIDLWCLNGKSYKISAQAFLDCYDLKTIYLPKGLTELEAYYCMSGCTSIEKIYWGGDQAEWNAVKKYDDDWNYNTPNLMGDLLEKNILECGYTHS